MDLFSGFWTLIVAAIAFLGGCCFAVMAPSGYLDQTTANSYTLLGVVGTSFVAVTFFAFCRRPSAWRFLELRRNIVLVVISLAWLFGAVGGFVVFYVIPRSIV